MFTDHKDWIVTIKGGYAKISALNYESARQIAFDKFGQSKCGLFYPANTTLEQQADYKKQAGYDLQTAENIIEKYKLSEV